MEHAENRSNTRRGKVIVILLLFFSFVNVSFPISIFNAVFVLDFLLAGIVILYFVDSCLGLRTYVTREEKYMWLFILLIILLSVARIVTSGSTDFPRMKTAIGAIGVLLFVGAFITIISNIFRNGNFLPTLGRYFYWFCFADSLYIFASFLAFGSSREARIQPLIEGFRPFNEMVLYVYGYTLSKCLIHRKWRIFDLLILLGSSFLTFASYYRSFFLIWVLLTLLLIGLSIRNPKRRMIAICQALLLTTFLVVIGFLFVEKDVLQMLEFTFEEIKNIPILLSESFSPDTVDAFTDAYGASRFFIWVQALNHIASHPWFGNGLGFEIYLGAQSQITQVFSEAQQQVATFHNQILGFLVDYGIIGTLLIYVVLVKLGLLSLKLLRQTGVSRAYAHGVYCFIVIYVVYLCNSFIGGEMIPPHAALSTVVPLYLFIAALLSELKHGAGVPIADGADATRTK